MLIFVFYLLINFQFQTFIVLLTIKGMSLISTLPYVGYKNVYVAIGSGKWGQLPEGFLFRKFPTLSKKKKKKNYIKEIRMLG